MATNKTSDHHLHIVYRCDSSSQIGGGHISRCLALAELFSLQMNSKNQIVNEFFCRDLPGNINSRIKRLGFEYHSIPNKFSEGDEINFVNEHVRNCDYPILVFDHYGISKNYESPFKKYAYVIVIDDLANRSHDCNLLIDANFSHALEERYNGLIPANSDRLLGPGYSLLRPEFLQLQSRERVRDGVLVFFGNSDPTGESLKFIRAIKQTVTENIYKVITTVNARFYNEVLNEAKGVKNLKIICEPSQISELMLSSSLYFGSGGTITWERMYCGLPGLVVTVASNQEPATRDLANSGYHLYYGRAGEVDYRNAIQECESLLASPDRLVAISELSRKLVKPLNIQQVMRYYKMARKKLR